MATVWENIGTSQPIEIINDIVEVVGLQEKYATLGAALTALGSTEATIVVKDNQTIQTPTIVPANITLWLIRPGRFTKSGTGTLTINGPFSAGLYQVFYGFAAGDIIFTVGSVKEIYPEWWQGDDTTQVQLAIDTSSVSNWIPIGINKKFTLTSPIIIDRPVDTTYNEFTIFGHGLNAGFYTSSNINMFTSSLIDTYSPVSEHIVFENIRFEIIGNGFVLDGDKFLRMRFLNNYFYGARLAFTTKYYQSFTITGSHVQGWSGVFLEAVNGGGTYGGRFIDFHEDNNSFEFGSEVNSIVFKTGGAISGSSFTNGLAENFHGPFLDTYGVAGTIISGKHLEAIETPAIKLGITTSVCILGNTFVGINPTGYAIDCGTTLNIYGAGNDCDGNLYDDHLMTRGYGDGLISSGDRVTGNLYYGITKNQFVATGTLTGFTSNPTGYFQVSRSGSLITISFSTLIGESNSGVMELVDVIPVQWLPSAEKFIILSIKDNGVVGNGLMRISASGITFFRDPDGNLFTSSGEKGLVRNTISYSILP